MQIAPFWGMRKRGKDKMILKDPKNFPGADQWGSANTEYLNEMSDLIFVSLLSKEVKVTVRVQ